ncbi:MULTISPECIES: flavodoxin [Aneurinibacillus]|uniref:Flavodoxin n=1 Tax=Aneurinibacillus thermoaerophilus TaxID=143495 RepID=A0A1G7Y5X6_ANETH|nr:MULTISPECIES: flavodoxin [Aneurinibacillus]AMA72860.1 flavodoxin [Aneurinibacillus sp. XH2]MED0677640.1 flavodoxin [Aneurinibacillus thermoaerophilus]MED0680054.1 flavodoxin [Aneurinibacillus thermoaerophilus]MED0736775.1 flavodoxin [Aneurinibacillus thermoaerophilus]MED0758195.1 flavodoxin [Aneurinibacillus thermoaerophilus]
MANVILVYASLSGNTEEIAELVAEGVKSQGVLVDIKSVVEINATDLLDYDGFLLGAYTWGDGELPDEFLDFYDDMESLDLTGKKAAIFGSGDTSYPDFCAAVDILEERAKASGADVTLPGLKVELAPEKEEKDVCRDFGKSFAATIT